MTSGVPDAIPEKTMQPETVTADGQEEKTAAPEKPRGGLLAGLLISAITVILFLGIVEAVGYVWERNTAQGPLGWTLVAARRLELERHGPAEEPYYLFVPNRSYNWEGIDVEINSYGFRTTEFALPKAAGTTRIMNLGDSIAFGWEVAEADTYGRRVEAALNERGDGRQYEVLNTGIPTWNLEASRNFFLNEGLDYEPDLLILDITLVNDIYGRGPNISEEGGLLQWLRDNTYSWPFMTTQARFLAARQQGPEAIPVLNPPTEASAYFPLRTEHPKWDEVWGYIADMLEAAEENNIPVIIITFPTAFQLNSAAHPDVPQQVLGERAAAAGIPMVDLLPVYGEVCAAAAGDACEGYENLLFADVWMHPNPLGHELAAEELLREIEEILR